jgi:hypothetical protein
VTWRYVYVNVNLLYIGCIPPIGPTLFE